MFIVLANSCTNVRGIKLHSIRRNLQDIVDYKKKTNRMKACQKCKFRLQVDNSTGVSFMPAAFQFLARDSIYA